MLGRPKESVELSGSDGQPLALSTILQVILTALGDDQAARIKVAAAFHMLGKQTGTAGCSNPGDSLDADFGERKPGSQLAGRAPNDQRIQ
jgi:hypothetical protein